MGTNDLSCKRWVKPQMCNSNLLGNSCTQIRNQSLYKCQQRTVVAKWNQLYNNCLLCICLDKQSCQLGKLLALLLKRRYQVLVWCFPK